MKTGRNEPCPCGSGKKYKQCCLNQDEEASRLFAQMQTESARNIFASNYDEMLFEDWHSQAEEETEAWEEDSDDDEEEDWDGEWEREAKLAEGEHDGEAADDEDDSGLTPEEAEWRSFFTEGLEGKIAYFEKLLEQPDSIDEQNALNLLEEIFNAALKENARTRYEELIEKFHRRAPEAYHAGSFAYLTNRINSALVLGNEAALPRLVEELAMTDVESFEEMLYALAYYGKLEVINAAMPLVCPSQADEARAHLWDNHLAGQATRYLAFAQIERDGTPQAGAPRTGETNWYEAFAYFSKIPAERLARFMALLAGEEQRRWSPEDFHVTAKRRNPGAPTVAQNLFELTLQFQGYARRARNVSFCRVELGREQLHNYMLRRAWGELLPPAFADKKPEELAALRQQMHPAWPAHARLLCPDLVTLSRYVFALLQFDDSDFYLRAALFELLPDWLDFLVAQRLLEPAQREQTLRELSELQEHMLHMLQSFARDPNLHQDLLHQPWPQNSATRGVN